MSLYLIPGGVLKQFATRLRLLAVLALCHAVCVELQREQEVSQHLPHHLLRLIKHLPQSDLGLAEISRQLENSKITHSADQEPPETSLGHFVLVGDQVPDPV